MNKALKRKNISIAKIIFLFLFVYNFMFCLKVNGFDEGYGPTLTQTQHNGYKWYLSTFGGKLELDEQTNKYKRPSLSADFSDKERKINYKDFSRNEDYGWYEWERGDGKIYVVLAGATVDLQAEKSGYEFFPGIHYFKLGKKENSWSYDVIQFRFASWSKDENIYDAIILDSYDVAMNPTKSGKDAETQWLAAYMFPLQEKSDYEKLNNIDIDISDDEKQELINFGNNEYSDLKKKATDSFSEKEIQVTDDGTFTELAKGDTIGTFFLNFFSRLIICLADAIQTILASAATDKPIESYPEVTYSKTEIENDENMQNKFQVMKGTIDQASPKSSEDEEEINIPNKYPIHLPNYILNQAGFDEEMFTLKDEELQIPVMPIDLYTMTRTKVNITDIDFFSNENTNQNKFWLKIKEIVKVVSKAVLYITIALALTVLIWRSLMLVIASFSQNPERAAKAKRAINSLMKNIFLIFIVYFIVTIMIYGYKTVVDMLAVDKENYYILRFTLDDVVSFNTNTIGYIRFLTTTTNGLSRFLHALLYLVMALLNALWFVALVVRMLLIALFIIIAPLTAIMTVSNEAIGQEKEAKGVLHFYNWFIIYTTLVFAPILVIVGERILTLMLL